MDEFVSCVPRNCRKSGISWVSPLIGYPFMLDSRVAFLLDEPYKVTQARQGVGIDQTFCKFSFSRLVDFSEQPEKFDSFGI